MAICTRQSYLEEGHATYKAKWYGLLEKVEKDSICKKIEEKRNIPNYFADNPGIVFIYEKMGELSEGSGQKI